MDIRLRSYLMLCVTAFGWALSTILIKLYINEIPAFHLMLGRFGIAFIIITAFNSGIFKTITKRDIYIGSILGFYLFAAYGAAVSALSYTSASKSGFLVALSVLFVPIVNSGIKRKIPNVWTIVSVMLSLVGLYLISGMNGDSFNYGDFLSILCPIFYTFYILMLDKHAKEINESVLVLVQLFSVTLFSLVVAVFIEGFNPSVIADGFIPVLLIAVFGTALATLFQAKAQQHASPESVGIILLGEPLLTLIMAVIILNENVVMSGLIGAGIIFASLFIAVVKKI